MADETAGEAGSWYRRTAAKAAGVLLLIGMAAGCDLGVTNPGNISDDALNSDLAISPLVAGMAADFATGFDQLAYFMGIASAEITHTGAFFEEQQMERGELLDNNTDAHWNNFHRARWVAEAGLERMKTVLGDGFDTDPRTIEAYTWIGFSNRVLGEYMCQAVIDGGPAEASTVHLERAEAAFTEALTIAQALGEEEWITIAYAGRAQIRLLRENWAGAAADAANVPDSFLYEALYSSGDGREYNWLANESHVRAYFSTHNTFADGYYTATGDERMRWTDMKRVGVDGRTPYKRQEKYPDHATPIAIAKGPEMRLIEAEVLLRGGDVSGALQKINHVRVAANVDPVSAANAAEAWQRLWEERQIVLWMEARHLPDRRRLDDPFLQGRGSCIPISEREKQTNPNLNPSS